MTLAQRNVSMLIGFRLRNFRSFLNEQTFGYCTSADRAHESTHCVPTGMKSVPRLSKSAVVFGPNGSGKTNFLRALQTLRDLVLHSTAYSELQFAQRHTPFQLGPSAHRTTDFEIDILVGRVRYRYSVSYDAHRVWSERLLVYRTGKSQRLVLAPLRRRDRQRILGTLLAELQRTAGNVAQGHALEVAVPDDRGAAEFRAAQTALSLVRTSPGSHISLRPSARDAHGSSLGSGHSEFGNQNANAAIAAFRRHQGR